MNQIKPLQSPAKQTHGQTANPFARALAETENAIDAHTPGKNQGNPFADALAQAGGSLGDFANPGAANYPNGSMPDWWNPQQGADLQKQQAELKRQQELQALRKKLHDQVNPVDNISIYDQRQEQVKKQIEELKKELAAMSREVVAFHKEIDLTLNTTIVEPGLQGSYFMNFFHQLRQFIAMLRQHIHSASTWARQASAKAKKKPKRGGLLIQGTQAEQTATIFDTMHHERSSTYGGS